MYGSGSPASCSGPGVKFTVRRKHRSAVAAGVATAEARQDWAHKRRASLAAATVATGVSLLALLPLALSSSATVASVCIVISAASLGAARTLMGARQRHDDRQLAAGARNRWPPGTATRIPAATRPSGAVRRTPVVDR